VAANGSIHSVDVRWHSSFTPDVAAPTAHCSRFREQCACMGRASSYPSGFATQRHDADRVVCVVADVLMRPQPCCRANTPALHTATFQAGARVPLPERHLDCTAFEWDVLSR